MARPSGTGEGEWRAAIRRACNKLIVGKAGEGDRAIHALAAKLVEAGLAGDMAAIQEIGNRIDGRPAQSVTVTETPLALEGPSRLQELGRRITYLLALAAVSEPASPGDDAKLVADDKL